MCICSGGNFECVYSTRVFGARLQQHENDLQQQITIMSNVINHSTISEETKSLSIVIPIPLFGKNATDIMITKVNSDFFDLLDKDMGSPPKDLRKYNVPVEERSPYKCSLVGTYEELAVLDHEKLHLDDAVMEHVKKFYTSDTAFLILETNNLQIDVKKCSEYTLGFIHPADPHGDIRFPTVKIESNEPKRQMSRGWFHQFYAACSEGATLDLIHAHVQEENFKAEAKYSVNADTTVKAVEDKIYSPWKDRLDWNSLKRFFVEGTHGNVDAKVAPIAPLKLLSKLGYNVDTVTKNAEHIGSIFLESTVDPMLLHDLQTCVDRPEVHEFRPHSKRKVELAKEYERNIKQKQSEMDSTKRRLSELQSEMKTEVTAEKWEEWKLQKVDLTKKASELQINSARLQAELNTTQGQLKIVVENLKEHCSHPYTAISTSSQCTARCNICGQTRSNQRAP